MSSRLRHVTKAPRGTRPGLGPCPCVSLFAPLAAMAWGCASGKLSTPSTGEVNTSQIGDASVHPNGPGGGGGGSQRSDGFGDAAAGGAGAGDAAPMPPPQVGSLGTDAVQAEPNLDSAILRLPEVKGARDYRVYASNGGTTAQTDSSGRETLTGGVVYCAGFRQHNNKALATPEVMRAIEVTDLHGPTEFIVEALDRPCPFPGLLGHEHGNYDVGNDGNFTAEETKPFSFYTEDEVRGRYGTVILNGQGWGPTVGLPAPPDPPKVLATGKVTVTPLPAGPRTTAFFDDFSTPDHPKTLVARYQVPSDHGYLAASMENAKWSFHQYSTQDVHEKQDVPAGQAYIDRGQLHVLNPDWRQGVMGSITAIPKKLAHVSATRYLHVTYEVGANATNRRYPMIALCGSDKAGETLDTNGVPKTEFIQTPGFFSSDGVNPTLANWNCLQVLHRGGIPSPVGNPSTIAETNFRVVLDKAGAPAREGVIEVSPVQINAGYGPDWYRRMEGGKLTTPVLDDQLQQSPRTRFDLWLRRDRAVLYVNGEQRVCNDFPATPLTMAEGMLVFGNVLYHTLAERHELITTYVAPYDDTGQLQILKNTPWVDERFWDNVGFDEDIESPPSFQSSNCYVAKK